MVAVMVMVGKDGFGYPALGFGLDALVIDALVDC